MITLDKKSFFLIFTQNIDCGYTSEPPQVAQNIDCGYTLEPPPVPTIYDLEHKKENNVYHCKPKFHCMKVGCKGGSTLHGQQTN